MDLEIRHLRLVTAIADTGSVTRAGERLFLTQSALSHQLRDIEGRLKTPLFHRIGKRMVPTPAGEDLLRSATQVLDLMDRTEDSIKRSASGHGGVLRITTQCYTCYHWLPNLLKQFRVGHPTVDVQIDATATAQPVKSILEGRLDLAVMTDRITDRRLAHRPLFQDEMFVIMSPTHPLATRPHVTAEDFAAETLLTYSPKEDNSVYQRVLVPAGVTPKAIQQVQLTEAILELVKAGLGISAMAGWAIEPYVRSGAIRAVPLTRRRYRRQWTAVMLRDMATVPYMKDFIDLLTQEAPCSTPRLRRGGLLELVAPVATRGR